MNTEFWFTLILIIDVVVALVIIGLVLLQHGKGADVGAAFGGGSSGSLFGASGSANFLSRTTAALAAVFFITTLLLAYMASDRPRGSSGVMDNVREQPASPASQIPAPGDSSKASSKAPAAAPSGAAPAAPTAPASAAPSDSKANEVPK